MGGRVYSGGQGVVRVQGVVRGAGCSHRVQGVVRGAGCSHGAGYSQGGRVYSGGRMY